MSPGHLLKLEGYLPYKKILHLKKSYKEIYTPKIIFNYFLQKTQEDESAALTPIFGILDYESNEERIHQTGQS